MLTWVSPSVPSTGPSAPARWKIIALMPPVVSQDTALVAYEPLRGRTRRNEHSIDDVVGGIAGATQLAVVDSCKQPVAALSIANLLRNHSVQ